MKALSGEWLVSEASEGDCETPRRSSERYRLWRGFGPSTAHVRSSERTSPASSEVEHRPIGGRRSLTRNQRGRQRGEDCYRGVAGIHYPADSCDVDILLGEGRLALGVVSEGGRPGPRSLGAVAQSVRVPPCHGGSRGFKSRRSRSATIRLPSDTYVIVFSWRSICRPSMAR